MSNYGLPSQLIHRVEKTKASLQQDSSQRATQAVLACEDAKELLLIIDTWWQNAALFLPVQPLHGDYGGGNILFQSDTIVAILDFDFLGIRERVFELAYTTYWMLKRLEPDTALDDIPWEKVTKLLAEYNQVSAHPLTQQEWAAFPFEMARVPLYWIAEAGFTPHPLEAVQAMTPGLVFSQWLLDHADDVSNQLRG